MAPPRPFSLGLPLSVPFFSPPFSPSFVAASVRLWPDVLRAGVTMGGLGRGRQGRGGVPSKRSGHLTGFTISALPLVIVVVIGVVDNSDGEIASMMMRYASCLATAWTWGATPAMLVSRFTVARCGVSLWAVVSKLTPFVPTVFLPTSLVGDFASCSTVTSAQYGDGTAGTTGPEKARTSNPGGGGGADVAAATSLPTPLCHDPRSMSTCRPPGGWGRGTHALSAVPTGADSTPIWFSTLQRLGLHGAGGVGPIIDFAV